MIFRLKNIIRFACVTLLLLSASVAANAQEDPYDGLWREVSALEEKGLLRSAWEQADSIYGLARRQHNEPQQVKALIYQLKYRQQLEEEANVQNIRELQQATADADQPARAVLQSMLAEVLWDYQQAERYRLYDRTDIRSAVPDSGITADGLATWSVRRLQQEITGLYEKSLQEEDVLKHTSLAAFGAIILEGKNTLRLRPTLYDLLAHRALDYYTNDESGLTAPASTFEISDAKAFAPAREFASAHFDTANAASPARHAVELMQDLLRFHAGDAQPAALLDADLERLAYMRRKSVREDKDSLYEQALRQLIGRYPNEPAAAEASYLLAQLYYEQGQQYDAVENPVHQFEIRKAKDICEKISARFPASEGGIHCRQLLETIQRPSVGLQTENVNLPQQPFRCLVTYKNVDKVYFRLLKLPEAYAGARNRGAERERWQQYLRYPVYARWAQSLPDPADYQEHAAEVKIDALPPGYYVLLGSGDSAFSEKDNPVVLQELQVSAISYAHDDKGNYFVLDRKSGRPLKHVKVRAWKYQYDYTARQNVLKEAGQYTTNREGYFKIAPAKEYRNLQLEFSSGRDTLFATNLPQVYFMAQQRDTSRTQTFLFTDRSVYRPGQSLFFKGILLETNLISHKSRALQDRHTLVYLYDANGQIIDSLPVKTNGFGSYAGSFRLPEGGLNGQMSLRDTLTEGRAYFSVEEYKRPHFQVTLTGPSAAYRLGDTVAVAGSALSYAGAQLDGATVSYRVVRRARFPYPWLIRRPGPSAYSPQREIASGTLKTDGQGRFSIRFNAIPDRQVPASLKPVFTYAVTAEITDINGETQTGETTVQAGYQALELEVPAEEKMLLDSLQNIRVKAANLDGKAVATTIDLKVYSLQAPDRFIRERYWQQPDQFVMSKEDYLDAFPSDEYRSESDPADWERSLVFETRVESGAQANIKALPAGWYAVEASATDTFGSPVKLIKYVQAYSAEMKKMPFEEALWAAPVSAEAEPGEEAAFLVGTADRDAFIIRQVNNMQDDGSFASLRPGKGVERVPVAVKESDRGGILYNYLRVKDNRFYTASVYIKVPWTGKQLHITYRTFRDKMLPGSKEHWKIHITGAKGDRVAAELLASMYDASLDIFRPHRWPDLDLYPALPHRTWTGSDNFAFTTGAGYFEPGRQQGLHYEKVYPSLNWFGYEHPGGYRPLNGRVIIGYDAMKKTLSAAPVPGLAVSAQTVESAAGNGAAPAPATAIPVRTNLAETAFFFPQLHTGSDGTVTLDFTMPEALTRWKLMMLAHTPDLAYAFSEKEVITQKPLMVVPNAPRFLREGDKMLFTAKVTSLQEEALNGTAHLQILDAATGEPLNGWIEDSVRPFSVEADGSTAVQWQVSVPPSYTGAVLYKVSAAAGNFSDGEQAPIPVLTNRAFITESLPLSMNGSGSKRFTFDALLQAPPEADPYGLTVEFSANPAWYAVQALPYLTEGTDACSEQLFDRYYANALAAAVTAATPGLQEIIRQWQTTDTAALVSNLQKNESLKNALLKETPWVLEAEAETAQKQRIAELFNEQELKERLTASLHALEEAQTPNGGFAWFSGMPDDRYITQYIMSGIGHLLFLKAARPEARPALSRITNKGVSYLDQRLLEDYRDRQKQDTATAGQSINSLQIQYLYMRSFFPDIPMDTAVRRAHDYYDAQARRQWTQQPRYLQGMIALSQYRAGNTALAETILRSLQETAIRNETLGMYWKDNRPGYAWYQAPVETQALLIETFEEIGSGRVAGDVTQLKTWLLKQKQTQHWPTTKATAEAVYALLLSGEDWLQAQPAVDIHLGDTVIHAAGQRQQAGTGYFKQFIPGERVKPSMRDIRLSVQDAPAGSPSWGAVYWQYFEDMDKVKAASSPLEVSRELYLEKNTPQGPQLVPLRLQDLKPGDKIKVRIVLKSSRNMDYVQVKDLRAACFEPVQMRDGYRWQGGLGYYQVTGDLSTQFYIDHLQKGTYVLEYEVFTAQSGSFHNGICTARSIYAPGFSSHTGGGTIEILNNEY